jgi:exopolysaccharide production protein ExoZ
VLVLLAHLYDAEQKYCTTNWMGLFRYGTLGVDIFFVISGIVMASVTLDRFGDRRYAFTFLYHRFTRIYPVLWVYTTIVLAAFLYNPLLINASSGHTANILSSYLLIPARGQMLLMQGWTLSFELYFYVATFVLLLTASRKSVPWLLAGWGVAVLAAARFADVSHSPTLSLVTRPILLEFLAGFAIFAIYRKARLHRSAGVAALAAALLWLTWAIIYNATAHGWDERLIEQGPWARPAFYGVFAALLLLGAVELERSGRIRYFRFLEAIGDWSYSIYLSHIIVMEIVARAIFHIAGRAHTSILLIDALAIPAALGVGYLSYTFIEKPIMAFFHRRPTVSRVANAHSAA